LYCLKFPQRKYKTIKCDLQASFLRQTVLQNPSSQMSKDEQNPTYILDPAPWGDMTCRSKATVGGAAGPGPGTARAATTVAAAATAAPRRYPWRTAGGGGVGDAGGPGSHRHLPPWWVLAVRGTRWAEWRQTIGQKGQTPIPVSPAIDLMFSAHGLDCAHIKQKASFRSLCHLLPAVAAAVIESVPRRRPPRSLVCVRSHW